MLTRSTRAAVGRLPSLPSDPRFDRIVYDGEEKGQNVLMVGIPERNLLTSARGYGRPYLQRNDRHGEVDGVNLCGLLKFDGPGLFLFITNGFGNHGQLRMSQFKLSKNLRG